MTRIEQFVDWCIDRGIRFSLIDGEELKVSAVKGALTPETVSKLKSRKAELISWLQSQSKDQISPRSVEHTDAVLSHAQQRLWFIDKLQGSSAEYNMPMALDIYAGFDLELAEQVFNLLIARHEILRTVYIESTDGPKQRVLGNKTLFITQQDVLSKEASDLSSTLNKKIASIVSEPFNLAEELMIRVDYLSHDLQADGRVGVLVINIHHIAADGWSMEVLTKEFSSVYADLSEKRPVSLPPVTVQYADYAQWQASYLDEKAISNQLSYWDKQLENSPPVHGIRLDFARPLEKQHQGGRHTLDIAPSSAQQLLELAKRHELTPFMLTHAALALVISRHSNSHDIVIGAPFANRNKAQLANMIGFFVNTQVLRVNTQHATLAGYLAHVRQVHLEAQKNQDVPFSQLVERMKSARNASYTPLFQIILTTGSQFNSADSVPQDQTSATQLFGYRDNGNIQAKFDLDIQINLHDQGGSLGWTYDKSLFKHEHIAQLNTHLAITLEWLGAQAKRGTSNLDEYPMLSICESVKLVEVPKSSIKSWPVDTITDGFAQSVQKYPNRVALACRDVQLSYSELDRQSTILARHLVKNYGVQPEQCLGIYMSRSAKVVIAIMAILKAGGCYVALDPSYPESRLQYICEDAQLSAVLISKDTPQAHFISDKYIDIDAIGCHEALDDISLPSISPNQLAYIVYTSGSTGKPKGVMVAHKQIVNTGFSQIELLNVTEQSKVVAFASFSFDASVSEWMMALQSGAALCVASDKERQEPKLLEELVETLSGTHITLPPTLLAHLNPSKMTGLKSLILAGEHFKLSQVKPWLSVCDVYNAYGPSEASVCATLGKISPSERLNIGFPIHNTQILVLNESLQLAPNGGEGELCIAGSGVSLGYCNKPEKTAQQFVENPYYQPSMGDDYQRLYRTGDLVRYLPDGKLEFLGRKDEQVKIRGFRIEPGEIETVLTNHEMVDSALVLAQEMVTGIQLIGYVKPHVSPLNEEQQKEFITQLNDSLADILPNYMLPSVLMVIEEWPLTPNGKIDKQALSLSASQEQVFIAPQNTAQLKLVEIWSGVLGLKSDSISILSNFFELGGHSLLTIKLIADIKSEFNVTLTVQEIFDTQSLQFMASLIIEKCPQGEVPSITAETDSNKLQPLSFAQQRLWFIDKLQGSSAEYNMPQAFKVDGRLDIERVNSVLQKIIERHAILRTVYIENNGVVSQRVRPINEAPFTVHELDFTELNEQEQKTAIDSRVVENSLTPFDLANDLMVRCSYLKMTSEQGILLFNMHHIASDGWSMEVLTNEFFTLLHSPQEHWNTLLPPLSIQYTDYAIWQNTYLTKERLASQRRYWLKQLHDIPTVHSLPLSFPRSEEKKMAGGVVTGRLPADVGQLLLKLAKKYKLTPFMLMHSAVALVLSRHSYSNDIVIGTPVANRQDSNLASLIGYFINTLVLRCRTDYVSLGEYLNHIREINLEAQSNQDIPFENLVEDLGTSRNKTAAPIFQIMLTANASYGVLSAESVKPEKSIALTPISSGVIQSKFDLDITINVTESGVSTAWIYDKSLFSQEYVELLNTHVENILQTMAQLENDDIPLFNLNMLGEQELDELANGCHGKVMKPSKYSGIHTWFERQVDQTPDAVALFFDKEQLTYAQLNERANQLAHYLEHHYTISDNMLIGVCTERSFEMVVTILGILKVGAAYVPLDPNYPEKRLSYIWGNAKLSLIVASAKVKACLGTFNGKVCWLPKLSEQGWQSEDFKMQSNYNLDLHYTSDALAYVIYTSGSTGQPKGVLIEHSAVCNLIAAQQHNYGLIASVPEVGMMLASFAFDASVEQLFVMLLQGHAIVLPSEQAVSDPNLLKHLIETHQVSHIDSTPSHLLSFVPVLDQKSIRRFVSGGEAFITELKNVCNAPIYNVYGPTESCVTSHISKNPDYIGLPIANTTSIVMTLHGTLSPKGAVGELLIGGAGLARGYLGAEELSSEKFIPNPYYNANEMYSSQYMYCTGDLVRYLPDGNIEFIGRMDDQVKIRGYRVELGEVETQLSNQEFIDSAVVIATELLGSQQLIGYIKPSVALEDDAHGLFISELKVKVSSHLPDYMVPSVLMVVEEWPLTPNGKVDRKALPAPDSSSLQGEHVAPNTDTERKLVAIWAELLNIDADKISTTANFFELGGHSLLSIRLVSGIRSQFAVELPIQEVFSATTLTELAVAIAHHQDEVVRAPLEAIARNKESYVVSFSQQRLWFIDQLQGGTPEYNMPMAFAVEGQLSLPLLTEVFSHIIARHEVLRTVYLDVDGEARQRILPMSEIDFVINEIDLCHLTGEAQLDKVNAYVESDIVTSFDLANEVMVRVSYVRTAQNAGVLLFNMHHIASDGWSMEVLTKEFSALYAAFSQGKPNPLPDLDIQYVDYAHWQRSYLDGEVLDKQLGYWAKQLNELPPVHSLPLSHVRPDTKSHVGSVVSGRLASKVSKQLQALAKRHQLTPFMLLHGAVSLLLSRHSNSSDIVIGTPVANRMQVELEPLIGFFVNTLVLRADTNHEELSAYLAHIRQVHLGAQSNQDVPFEQLVERLKIPRSAAYTPLFQVMMTTNMGYGVGNGSSKETDRLSEVSLTPYRSNTIQAKFDLSIDISIGDEGVGVNWVYDVSLFEEEYIERLNDHLCRLLTGLSRVAEGNTALHSLPMLSEKEEHHLIAELNDTAMEYPKGKCIHELFEQQARENPDNIAVVFEDVQLTYQELNARANQLAHYLVETQGITPDTLVGLCVERSLEMVIGIVGILKAGGAYVPLDPSYPKERLAYMMGDAQLTTIISHTQARAALSEYAGHLIDLDDTEHFAGYSTDNLDKAALELTSSHLAYVIYTSGSTGKPKGVMVEHKSLCNYFLCVLGYLTSDIEYSLMSTSLNFDATVTSLFGGWLKGKYVKLLEKGQYELSALQSVLQSSAAGLFKVTPAHLQALTLNETIETPHIIVVGGEIFTTKLAKKISRMMPNAQFINEYGPTESTVGCSFQKFTYSNIKTLDEKTNVHIGKPINNSHFSLFSQHNCMIPKGCIGELYIGGDGLARGYLNQSELTAERFIDNPYYDSGNPNSSARLYRTGDLVRYLPDGNLEFMGRVDDQVKIRGFRIELGEVETQLSNQEGVDSVLVMTKELAGSQQLVGYIKRSAAFEGGPYDVFISELKAGVSSQLPDYMVPSVLMVVTEWPLTPNGKIDRNALPTPDTRALDKEYVAPKTELEQALVEIWSELLGMDAKKISTTANFFELGGHSLLITRLSSQIRERLNIELDLKQVFDAKTLSDMADSVSVSTDNYMRTPIIAVERVSDLHPVSFSQQRLWFLDYMQGGTPEYNMPRVLRVGREFDLEVAEAAFNTIISRHEILRTVYIERNGVLMQRVLDMGSINFHLVVEDLRCLTRESLSDLAAEKVAREVSKPFDLASDLMLRVTYFKTSDNEGVLTYVMHHIACDGWSIELMQSEFNVLYQAFIAGEKNPLPKLPLQYADYAHWQRAHLEGAIIDAQLAYWDKQLAGVPVIHSLPLSYERPEIKQYDGAIIHGKVSAEIAQGLKKLAHSAQVTPFMLLHGISSLVLSRYSGSSDIVMGTSIANRQQSELESVVGYFANTMVLRVNTAIETLKEYLAHVKQVHMGAQENQDAPFEQIVDRLQLPRNTGHNPLFQILLSMDTEFGVASASQSGQHNENKRINDAPVQTQSEQARFDLNIAFKLSDNGLRVSWIYDTKLFSYEAIERINRSLCQLLTMVSDAQNIELPLEYLNMQPDEEVSRLIRQAQGAVLSVDEESCIHTLFEKQVLKTPDEIAVTFAEQSLTYEALNNKANQLAHYLREHYITEPDSFIGVCAERSLDMLIAVLAVLKAGGAYIPLDPEYPVQRLEYMIEDAQLSAVIYNNELGERLCQNGLKGIDLNSQSWSQYSSFNIDMGSIGLESSHLAYVIYTSGSTGKPKGVMIEHRSFVHFLAATQQLCQLNKGDNWLSVTSLSFDIAGLEIYLPLCTGAQVTLGSALDSKDPTKLLALIEQRTITHFQATPSTWKLLDSLPILKRLPIKGFIGGEAAPTALVQSLLAKGVELTNMYGPTETTVWSSAYTLPSSYTRANVSVGQPLANEAIYILDDKDELVPYGAVGEVCIGGVGLARGYLNREKLTAERFIDKQWLGQTVRLYKTGDLGRYLETGNLELVGRIGEQVKIRGYRIELDEINWQLTQLANVQDALVMSKEIDGEVVLVAYVHLCDPIGNGTEERREPIQRIKQQLGEFLPTYMVPTNYVFIDEWPLTPNGKIDKRALPQVTAEDVERNNYVAPTNEIEVKLCSIWEDALNLSQVGVQDNFFALGGDSMQAVKMVAAAHQIDIPLTLRQLFKFQTIELLASEFTASFGNIITDEYSDMHEHVQSFTTDSGYETLGGSDDLPTFWLVPPMRGGSTAYRAMAPYITQWAHVRCLIPASQIDLGVLPATDIEGFASEYAKTIMGASSKAQKITIGGFSFGGIVAFDLACRLSEAGWTVDLVLLDADPTLVQNNAHEELSFMQRLLNGLPEELIQSYVNEEFCERLLNAGIEGPVKSLFEQATEQNLVVKSMWKDIFLDLRMSLSAFRAMSVAGAERVFSGNIVWLFTEEQVPDDKTKNAKLARLSNLCSGDISWQKTSENHADFVKEPAVAENSRILKEHMAKLG